MSAVEVLRGDSPVVLGMPHAGLHLPEAALGALNETGRALADTDWNIDRLYGGLLPGATVVRAMFHRYVIDANRDPSGASLYPGQATTGLCPLTDFDGAALYRNDWQPDEAEVARRLRAFHAPYHAALEAELDRVRKRHGLAILYDCHSIRSRIPFLFDATLPDFNIGTHDGAACSLEIEQAVRDICGRAQGFTSVVNGRFKGGWTTRHYGRPAAGIHVIQMELAQKTYMDEAAPWTYRSDRAARLRPHLRTILETLDGMARSGVLDPERRSAK